MNDKACRYPNCDCPTANPTRLCNFVYCDSIGDFYTDKPLRPDEIAKYSAPRTSDAPRGVNAWLILFLALAFGVIVAVNI